MQVGLQHSLVNTILVLQDDVVVLLISQFPAGHDVAPVTESEHKTSLLSKHSSVPIAQRSRLKGAVIVEL